VLVQHEAVPPARLAGFLIVWAALALLTADALREARRRSAQTRSARTTSAEAVSDRATSAQAQSTSTSDSLSSIRDSTLTQASTSA
jgi:chloramphenicol-sensitive protein RarD